MKTIFLVDDSATLLNRTSSTLSKTDCQADKAASAVVAMTRFKAGLKVDRQILVDCFTGELQISRNRADALFADPVATPGFG